MQKTYIKFIKYIAIKYKRSILEVRLIYLMKRGKSMVYRNFNEHRKQRYNALKKCVEEKGRIPFRKENQKHAKLMMFMYESLQNMANSSHLQNIDGILFKIHFTSTYNISLTQNHNVKVILEYGISSGTSRFKAFDTQHMSVGQIVLLLKSFAEYYDLSFEEERGVYTKSNTEHKYTIRLPKEA